MAAAAVERGLGDMPTVAAAACRAAMALGRAGLATPGLGRGVAVLVSPTSEDVRVAAVAALEPLAAPAGARGKADH